METRKIQQVGGGTYTVSLPKEWAQQAEVSAGTVVDLHTHIDGLLVIQAGDCDHGATGPVEITIPTDGTDAVEQTLRAAYAAGAAEIRLTAPQGFSADQRRVVDRVARNLTGVAVAEESATAVTVRTMLDAAEVSISQSVRQLQFVALSMHRDAAAALASERTVEQPADRDDQADRLYAMIERHFERGLSKLDEVDALGLTRPELFQLWATGRELERVADHAERIARVAARLESAVATDLADDIGEISDTAQRVVEDAVSAVIDDAGVDTARQALSARDRVRADATDLDRRLFEAPASDYRLTHVVDSLERTAEHGGNIAELGLRRAVREGTLSPTADPVDADD